VFRIAQNLAHYVKLRVGCNSVCFDARQQLAVTCLLQCCNRVNRNDRRRRPVVQKCGWSAQNVGRELALELQDNEARMHRDASMTKSPTRTRPAMHYFGGNTSRHETYLKWRQYRAASLQEADRVRVSNNNCAT
jgi:hypothetical protein